MSGSNLKPPTSSNARPVKKEPQLIPSPTPSCVTTATALFGSGRPPSPTPSYSTTVIFGDSNRGQISIRPLSSIVDQDDQISTVSCPISTSTSFLQTNKPAAVAPENNTDWRFPLGSISDRLKYIFKHDDKYQDVTFQVEGSTTTERFTAHKLILRIASPVFDEKFKNIDEPSRRRDTIVVRDVEPATFNLLLKFIYTDEIDISDDEEDTVLSLLEASKLYEIRPLYTNCVKLLRKCMSDVTAIRACELAVSYEDQLLLDAALDQVASKADEIFQSENFLQLSRDNLKRLFAKDELRIREVHLFEAALRWGEHQCNKHDMPVTSVNLRELLLPLIPEIRFPLMKPEEFTFKVVPTTVLTSDEQIEIYKYFCAGTENQDKLPPMSFKNTPRVPRKFVEIDSGSSSDCREGGSASPEFQRRTSITNTDYLDLTTTEAESETASNVSIQSDNHKKSRKYERTSSHSSGTSKKRRKVEHESNRRESIDKSTKQTALPDLFSDYDESEKCIKLNNKTISLNSFIQDCGRNERRIDIESIELIDVKIDDFKSLISRKVYFPRLKNFEMKINVGTEEQTKQIIAENSFSLEKYLFFGCKNSSWSYEKLWSMGIEITVVINKVTVLRISHANHHVVLNKFYGAHPILRSLQDQPIKSLVYYDTQFQERDFPLCLKRMVILGIVENQCMNMTGFLQKFKQLKELILHSPQQLQAVKAGSKELILDSAFASKNKIRKFSAGAFHICIEPSIRFYNILVLSLWNVTWEAYFEDKFHHTFPKLEELYLFGPVKGSAKLLRNLLKIGSLNVIVCWICDFRLNDTDGKDMKNFLMSCHLSESDKSFVLRKREDKKSWEGSKITFKDFRHHFYKKFEFEYLYEDLDSFMSTPKTSA